MKIDQRLVVRIKWIPPDEQLRVTICPNLHLHSSSARTLLLAFLGKRWTPLNSASTLASFSFFWINETLRFLESQTSYAEKKGRDLLKTDKGKVCILCAQVSKKWSPQNTSFSVYGLQMLSFIAPFSVLLCLYLLTLHFNNSIPHKNKAIKRRVRGYTPPLSPSFVSPFTHPMKRWVCVWSESVLFVFTQHTLQQHMRDAYEDQVTQSACAHLGGGAA